MELGQENVEDPGGLLDRISDYQLLRWMEFYDLEPWGYQDRKLNHTMTEMQHGIGYSRIVDSVRAFAHGMAGGKGKFESTEIDSFRPSVIIEKGKKTGVDNNRNKKKIKSRLKAISGNRLRSIKEQIDQFQHEKEMLKLCGRPVQE